MNEEGREGHWVYNSNNNGECGTIFYTPLTVCGSKRGSCGTVKRKKKLLLAEEATTTKKWMKNGANGSHTRVKRRRHFSVGDTGYW